MPGHFLTDAERARLSRCPDEIVDEDLVAHFTVTADELLVVKRHRGDANRIGFALQLCTLRFLGFVPDEVRAIPARIVEYVAQQLDLAPEVLGAYGERDHTRTDVSPRPGPS